MQSSASQSPFRGLSWLREVSTNVDFRRKLLLLNSGGTGSGSKNAHPQARVVSARPRAPSVQCWQCSLSGVVLRGKEKRPFPLNTSSSCVINNVVRGHAPGTPPESILRQEDPAGTCGMLRLRQASCRLCSCRCWGVAWGGPRRLTRASSGSAPRISTMPGGPSRHLRQEPQIIINIELGGAGVELGGAGVEHQH